jgi:hypothetical protein
MKPLRSRAAVAIDGGGIRGVMVARALAALEEKHAFGSKKCNEVFHLAAGTSTGSIISAGLVCGLSGSDLFRLYSDLGPTVFTRTVRSALWPLFSYRYPSDSLRRFLEDKLGQRKVGDIKGKSLVITTFDLMENRTRFVKTGKPEYADWPVVNAVLASCAVPTYFPPVEGQFVDGGVGSYVNPCYLAAYEACIVKRWKPEQTTLISIGTGREPHTYKRWSANHYWPWKWLAPILSAFLESSDDEQVRVVKTFFQKLDFRRFQIDIPGSLPIDDASPANLEKLTKLGDELAAMIVGNKTDDDVLKNLYGLPSAMKAR